MNALLFSAKSRLGLILFTFLLSGAVAWATLPSATAHFNAASVHLESAPVASASGWFDTPPPQSTGTYPNLLPTFVPPAGYPSAAKAYAFIAEGFNLNNTLFYAYAPEGFQLGFTPDGNFGHTISFHGSTLTDNHRTIYVRAKANPQPNTTGVITHKANGNLLTATVAVSATPPPQTSGAYPDLLPRFITPSVQPSAAKSYVFIAEGFNLNNTLFYAYAPDGFELGFTPNGSFGHTISFHGSTLTNNHRTVYVRAKANPQPNTTGIITHKANSNPLTATVAVSASPRIIFNNSSAGGSGQELRLVAESSPEEHDNLKVRVFANPVKESFSALVEAPADEALTLHLCNGQGKVVGERSLTATGQPQRVEWSLASHPPGLYILRAFSARHRQTLKLVKQ
ncbi:MAG: T9SS type A sorting domain-containing protein [Sphingobacteriaceae bacterium]|nr:T9SS type A sorting domain-containing protein [Cytophagaceae bacterium]